MVRLFDLEMTTEVKDKGANQILTEISRIDGSFVTVGYHKPEISKKAEWRGRPIGNATVGQYAAWNEFGNRNQVARPTLGPMLDRRVNQYLKQTTTLMLNLYRRPSTLILLSALEKQGHRLEAWLKIEIKKFRNPQNELKTKRWKRYKKRGQEPLQFTRTMLKSITSKAKINPRPNNKLRRLMAKAENDLKKIRL